jgi:hypothetical protein
MPADTLVITTLDPLGRSTQNMRAFAGELRSRGAGLLWNTAAPAGLRTRREAPNLHVAGMLKSLSPVPGIREKL